MWLKSLPIASLVLLVDDYDAPLTRCLDSKKLFKEEAKEMAAFFALIKENGDPLRFFFMTGVLNFTKIDAFPSLNYLVDLSLIPDFGDLLGFTEDEVEENFEPFIQIACSELGVTKEDLLKRLKRHYGGFCFETKGQKRVFCPRSVLSFFENPSRGFANYWLERAGDPSALSRYLSNHWFQKPAKYGKEIQISLDELTGTADFDHINEEAILTQTGYLTIKETKGLVARLGYPNCEVAASTPQLYSGLRLPNRAVKPCHS